MATLELQGVSKRFGAVVVANALDLALAPSEALGVIGPNGAGKTTLFNMVAGVIRPDTGRVLFNGDDITRLSPAERCRRGIGRCFQIPQPFSGLTVFENLRVAALFSGRVAAHEADETCYRTLEITGLLAKANTPAGRLTLIERKRLELARALAGRPTLLLLDEIAGGLTPHECDELIVAIKAIRGGGLSIIWIEHVVHALLAVVDRLMVLSQGEKLAEGDPKTVMGSRVVHEIYLGVEADA